MEVTKIVSLIPSYRLWLLIFAVVLMLLLWSQPSDHISKFSTKKYDHPFVRRVPIKGPNSPPILAYWILGSSGENKRILRVLRAIYHPRNQYLLQLDSASSDHERVELVLSVHSQRVFQEFGNVNVVGKSYAVNPLGASGLAAVLHAAALLLKLSADWDWFVPLSTSDYPISTQDDILYAFTTLPRDLNFVGYTNETTLKKRQNVSKIAVDPGLYLTEKSSIFYAEESREKPDAFEIFGGSPWMILSRGFLDHCVQGLDNLPRKLLMYFNNVPFPLESYFHTVLCNTPEFQNTTMNEDLRYIVQNSSIKEDHRATNMSRFDDLMASRAIFAGPFEEKDPELEEIDARVLNRDQDKFVPGKWCKRTGLVNETTPSFNSSSEDYCSVSGDIDGVEPGAQGIKLQKFLLQLVEENKSVSGLCQSNVVQKERKK